MSFAEEEVATQAYSGSAAPLIILDGLLGVGGKPPLREPIRAACRAINRLRTTKRAYVFAVDLPTGLDADSGKTDRDCIVADFTVTIGYAKLGLLTDGASNYVGRLEVVPLEDLRPPETKPKEIIASAPAVCGLLPRRKYNSYKNQFGRIGVVAGSWRFIVLTWQAQREYRALARLARHSYIAAHHAREPARERKAESGKR